MTLHPISNRPQIVMETIREIGCDERSMPIFQKKIDIFPVRIYNLSVAIANIVKQEMISAKGDAAIHRDAISGKIDRTDALLIGTISIYEDFIRKIEKQDYPTLNEIATLLKEQINRAAYPIHLIRKNGEMPVLMGILNVTPDSFYEGGKYEGMDQAIKRCEEMIEAGANIIDIGGESSRPGSDPVSSDEEKRRVLPVLEAIKKRFSVSVSVDTTKSEVAKAAVEIGAEIVNDISGLQFDESMVQVAAQTGCRVVLMHIQGKPKDMQTSPEYADPILELDEYFQQRIRFAVDNGVAREKIIIDPGIGFGKRLIDNKLIIKNLTIFKKYGLPILVGASRKSMIGNILDVPADLRLFGTLGAHIAAYFQGADILRVHDVKEHKELLQVYQEIMNSQNLTDEKNKTKNV